MGSFNSPKPPAPPAVERPQDIIDLVGGTVTRTVKGPDGRKQTIVERVPLSPEEDQIVQQANAAIRLAMEDITRLTNAASAFDLNEFKPVIDATRREQEFAREEGFKAATRQTEEALAQRGLGDSSSAAVTRSQRERAMTDVVRQDELALMNLAETLRDKSLDRNYALLSAGTGIVDASKNRATGSAALGLNAQLARQSVDANISAQTYQNQLAAFNSRGPSFGTQLLGAAGTLAGGLITAPAGSFGASLLLGNKKT